MKIENQNKNKKIFFFLFIFIILLLPHIKGESIKYLSSKLEIKNIDPSFPKSGDLLTITFELTNMGNKRGNFYVYFLNNSIFQYISKDENIINIGPKETKEFKVYFKINPNTISGRYPLIAKVISGTGEEKKYTFFIKIKNEPNILIKQNNIICLIGKECNLSLELLNNGYGKAKNIVINFNLPSSTIEFKSLEPLASKLINTKIFIPENVEEGIYNLKALIYFIDENNNIIKKEINIPLELKSNVNLEISSLQYDKENNYIKIKIENPGEGKAKNIKMNVELPDLGLKQTFYIGTLKEGEDSTIYFYLPSLQTPMENKIKSNQHIEITLYWEDNKEKQKKFSGNLIISSKAKEERKIVGIVILSIVVLSILLIYLITKKRKRQKDEED